MRKRALERCIQSNCTCRQVTWPDECDSCACVGNCVDTAVRVACWLGWGSLNLLASSLHIPQHCIAGIWELSPFGGYKVLYVDDGIWVLLHGPYLHLSSRLLSCLNIHTKGYDWWIVGEDAQVTLKLADQTSGCCAKHLEPCPAAKGLLGDCAQALR